eukprot:jgi/Chlat1/7787/Chrsp66S07254
MAAAGAAAAAGDRLQQLAKLIKPALVNGVWRKAAISARIVARMRREELLAGRDWPFEQPRKEMKTVMKGHKCDREKAERVKRIEENMKNMPQILADWKKSKMAKKSPELTMDDIFLTKEEKRLKARNVQ